MKKFAATSQQFVSACIQPVYEEGIFLVYGVIIFIRIVYKKILKNKLSTQTHFF